MLTLRTHSIVTCLIQVETLIRVLVRITATSTGLIKDGQQIPGINLHAKTCAMMLLNPLFKVVISKDARDDFAASLVISVIHFGIPKFIIIIGNLNIQ